MAVTDRSKHLDATEDQARERALIAVVSELVRELHQQSRRHVDVSRSSQLDRDLGIDSVGTMGPPEAEIDEQLAGRGER